MSLSNESSALFDTSSIQHLASAKVAIVCTEWNEKIVAEQIKGCTKVLDQHKAIISHKIVVPGSFEIPFACHRLISHFKENKDQMPEAIIAFGAVIRGGTPHFEYVCKAVTEGIAQLNVTTQIPIIFGVLTVDNEAQVWERLGGSHGHKGEEAALAALKMIQLCRTY